MTHLVIGTGEVGSALQKILLCDGHDPKGHTAVGEYDMIHICYPYFDGFEDSVLLYQEQFSPQYTVIHSTVPIGTSNKVGATHSPIRGMHPNLEKSIRTFIKHYGGPQSLIVASELLLYGIPFIAHKSSETTEAGKLLELMHYGAEIAHMKEVWNFCKDNNLDFKEVYTNFANTYNSGYQEMGQDWATRPVLKYVSGKIGGHCIIQNMDKLNTPTAKRIIKENETYE